MIKKKLAERNLSLVCPPPHPLAPGLIRGEIHVVFTLEKVNFPKSQQFPAS